MCSCIPGAPSLWDAPSLCCPQVTEEVPRPDPPIWDPPTAEGTWCPLPQPEVAFVFPASVCSEPGPAALFASHLSPLMMFALHPPPTPWALLGSPCAFPTLVPTIPVPFQGEATGNEGKTPEKWFSRRGNYFFLYILLLQKPGLGHCKL